ncbi:succinate dehydrogenase and fumarate reductase iron-sulfur protein [Gloeomargarita lithophora Alchichica-D10]|uniref:succinate dehydrogenase n=1 Tax=Gloeomargarita lithophora Alchichica-D10 TaxID=1188229 RepID=A0A1J0AGE1_9CYAN|nr:succinate dehydrogenase/fumarate reductase iron-sulfur subunit [Gloeomargarita lithophora]APB35006.1 succinate dehydrogenase and fumarate reductase iron-sulfur protein [Gloeomargarita lithophora Alchichica-D10]
MLDLILKIWRQSHPEQPGQFVTYPMSGVAPAWSLLEVLDQLNETLMQSGQAPVAFDSDCREGICGSCGLLVDGMPHGQAGVTTCQVYMRRFHTGQTLTLEPFPGFPVLRDLVVDRRALDRIMAQGGYISVNGGSAPEANSIPIAAETAAQAFNAATCIGCGACVAACPNGAAALFVGAKITHLSLLPQGQPEAGRRVQAMVAQMDAEGLGHCSNHGECAAVCPQTIPLTVIARLRRQYWRAWW